MNFLQEESVGDTFNTFFNDTIHSWLFLKGTGAKLQDVSIQNLTVSQINGDIYPPSGAATDEKVKCTNVDLNAGYLQDKITSSDNSLTFNVVGAAGTDQDFDIVVNTNNVDINNLTGVPLDVDKGGTGLINVVVGNVPVGNGTSTPTRFLGTPAQETGEVLVTDVAAQTMINKVLDDASNEIRANSLNNSDNNAVVIDGNVPVAGYILTAESSTKATWQNPTLFTPAPSRGNMHCYTTTFLLTDTTQIINPTLIFNSSASKDFTFSAGKLKYTGSGTPHYFFVSASIGIHKFITGPPTSNIYNVGISTTGLSFALDNTLRADITNAGNLDPIYGSINGIIALNTNDEVAVVGQLQQAADSGDVVFYINFSINSLGA